MSMIVCLRPMYYRICSVVVVLPASTCAMMPMLRISERAVVRGIADFHDSFGLHQTGPYEPSLPSSKVRGCRDSIVLLLVGRTLAIPRACHLMAALVPSPGSKGRRRAATYH